MGNIRRLFVEKKAGFDTAARALFKDLTQNLNIQSIESVRILQRYDIEGMTDQEFQDALFTVFSEPPVDFCFHSEFPLSPQEQAFSIEYLPGQFDQRADSAAQCIQIMTHRDRPRIQTARMVVLKSSVDGGIPQEDIVKIKNYCINPVDSREASLEMPETLARSQRRPEDVEILTGFCKKNRDELNVFLHRMGLAMSLDDLLFCQEYFREDEKRDPSITEIKMLDTYWSDHCRHTTFMTCLKDIKIEEAETTRQISQAYQSYLESRAYVYESKQKDICLMDLATIAMKELRKNGRLENLEVSEEINACSICVPVDVDGQTEEWLVMFKNETHNHPTEIEPFGGAATCLGGAIRDPLSGRSYVYQAMRVTGSADPRQPIDQTLPGKLPQRKITLEAAHGYSSYGNQIGLATGDVCEVYHPGYVAKRMEVGAVIAAAPRENVIRGVPICGDIVLLVGGKTGRDGIGGATGSSKEHTETALENSSEVQKGDPPTERKLQRLFRNGAVAKLIKRCNDFGAGGVSVAIGELTEGLDIDLDAVPRKYEGLDGTELALSESQERMAVVIDPKDEEAFKSFSSHENLEAIRVASVTSSRRLRMMWRGKTIVDLSREFIDSNGVKQNATVVVEAPSNTPSWRNPGFNSSELHQKWFENMGRLNVCSQRGLVERFDSTIGTGSVNHPFGGAMLATPAECMVAKIPILNGDTSTVTLMSHGFNPEITSWSPFHGGIMSVVESVARIVASGGDPKGIWLTLQEYFEKLGKDPRKWGKPFSAVLGAFWAQKVLEIAAIGGKDSMSGTFRDLNVPPTLISFAVCMGQARHILTPEFHKANEPVFLLKLTRDSYGIPDLEKMKKQYSVFHELVKAGHIQSAHSLRTGGLAEAISKMCFGNGLGFEFQGLWDEDSLFRADYGDLVFVADETPVGLNAEQIGITLAASSIRINEAEIDILNLMKHWESPLESVFRTQTQARGEASDRIYSCSNPRKRTSPKMAQPRVFIPVFPGTNCEYDSARAFEKAGARAETFVFGNLNSMAIEESLAAMIRGIQNAQILMIPGGFSAGDEPEGSGKFIASVFRNPGVSDAVMDLIQNRDGLILGICNGFQALVKLGLLPFGEIRPVTEHDPTLTFNQIGRHVSAYVRIKTVSNLSPWLAQSALGSTRIIPVSNGEGRFVAPEPVLQKLFERGQVATQYVDRDGMPTVARPFNPSNSMAGIEGITSPDGRIFGKMGHSERIGPFIGRNVPGEKDQRIFEAGVAYFCG